AGGVRAPAQNTGRLAGAGAGRPARGARARTGRPRGHGPPGGRPRRAARAGGLQGAGGEARSGVSALHTLAPGKVNLCLFVGPPRPDGRHELVSLVQAVSLADDVRMGPAEGEDEVVCEAVEGENLAARALAA